MLGSLGSLFTRQFFAVEDFGVTDLEKNIFRRTTVFALFLVFGPRTQPELPGRLLRRFSKNVWSPPKNDLGLAECTAND